MTLSAALHATVDVLRRRPADLLPFYMLGAAIPVVARVGTFLGLAVAYAYLEVTGRLDEARSAVAGRDLNPPEPGVQPDAFAGWAERVAPVVEPLLPPAVIAVLAVALVLTLLAALFLAAAVSAGQIAACDARLRDERGLTAGIAGLRRHWLTFLGAYVLEGVVWAAVSALALLAVGGGFTLAPLVGFILAPVAFLLWLAVVVATRALFVFVPTAVIVDDVGLFDAIRASAGFTRRNPVEAIGYYATSIGTFLAFFTAVGVLTVVQLQAVVAPLAVLAVSPALDLLKTGLYDDYRGSLSPPSGPGVPVPEQFSTGLRRGLREVARFVRETPGSHGLALVVVATGALMGWVAAEPLVGSLETSIEARLADHVPPVAALQFFANNWTVAYSMAFAGVALAVPAALSLWFNGLLLGVYARLEVAPVKLAAFVLPHGVVEIPALLESGALGIYLGLVAWRTWRGRAGREDLADAMERAFWVVLGLGVLLAVAGLVEGFVSPYYWRPFL